MSGREEGRRDALPIAHMMRLYARSFSKKKEEEEEE
jgi:hypothetical protein